MSKMKINVRESKKSEALTKDTTVVGQLDNSDLKWIKRTLKQIKKDFPNVESDAAGCTITLRGKLNDVSAVLDAFSQGIPSLYQDKGGDFLPNAAGAGLDYDEVDKVLAESKKSEGGSIRDTKCVRCGGSPAMYKLDGCSGNFCLSCAKELHWECPKELKDKKTAGKKESMERCDSCGAVMTEYDYDRYGGLCKRCRDKGEAKKPAESSKKNEDTLYMGCHGFFTKDGKTYIIEDESPEWDGEIVGKWSKSDWERIDTDKVIREWRKDHPTKSFGESRKKSEGIGDRIKMGIDYNMFMRMCRTAAYLDEDEDYWDALWEYYSEMGEIEDALVFFDNLFQYTAWCDADELYDEYLDDKFKDDSKSKEECIEAAIDDGDLQAYKHEKGNYLVIL